MNKKVVLAKTTLGVIYTVGGVVAAGLLYFLAQFLIWWAASEIISFSIVVGLITLGLLVFGGGFAWDWARTTIEDQKKQEKLEEEESRREVLIAKYKKTWGEDAVPPRTNIGFRYDLPPNASQRGVNIG